MNQKVVRKLGNEIEDAVAEVVMRLGLRDLPLLPSQQTMHLMAKAAVTGRKACAEPVSSYGNLDE